MLTYPQADTVLAGNSKKTINRYLPEDTNLISFSPTTIDLKTTEVPVLEQHLYTPDGQYLSSVHRINYELLPSTSSDLGKVISTNVSDVFQSLSITRGNFKLISNFFLNLLSSYESSSKPWIKEISSSRQELRISIPNDPTGKLQLQLVDLVQYHTYLKSNGYFPEFLLNFGNNITCKVINVRYDGQELFVKLYQALPDNITLKSVFWIVEELVQPTISSYTVIPTFEQTSTTVLSGPNFKLEQFENVSVATDFKTWDDLLTSNLETSQKIVDKYFEGSLSGIKLNIDYRYFENFIHFGSAVERVKNFRYKMALIEDYSDKINNIAQLPSDTVLSNNLQELYDKRNQIVTNFDDFEKFLFFQPNGYSLYTNYNEQSKYYSGNIDSWPKQEPPALTWNEAAMTWNNFAATWLEANSPDAYPYFRNNVKIDSTEGETYFIDLLEKATAYDELNPHNLRKTIPNYIVSDGQNDEYLLFVDMLGHHFDILWTYTNHLSKINTREENPKDGIPDELLYDVAKNMGFELLNGKSATDLWRYAIAKDENGEDLLNPNQNIQTLPESQVTKEIWRRIVNNLPYILKSKGTERAIRSIISCFGIPSTLITIKEYGGPSTFTEDDYFPKYIKDVYHYALLTENTSAYISQLYVDVNNNNINPNTVTFRVKSDNNYSYTTSQEYNLLTNSSTDLDIISVRKDSDNYNDGTISYSYISPTDNSVKKIEIGDLNFFDDSWHTVALSRQINTGSSFSSVNFIDYINDYQTLNTFYTFNVGDQAITKLYDYGSADVQFGSPVLIGINSANKSSIDIVTSPAPIANSIIAIFQDSSLAVTPTNDTNFVSTYAYVDSVINIGPGAYTVVFNDTGNSMFNQPVTGVSILNSSDLDTPLIELQYYKNADYNLLAGAIEVKLNGYDKWVNNEVTFTPSNTALYAQPLPIFTTDSITSILKTPAYVDYDLVTQPGNEYNYVDSILRVCKSLYGKQIYLKQEQEQDLRIYGPINIFDNYSTWLNQYPNIGGAVDLIFTPNYTLDNDLGEFQLFNGHLHEIRLWKEYLSDASLLEHTLSPGTYTFNVDREKTSIGEESLQSFNNLLARYSLSTKEVETEAGDNYQKSIHPNQDINQDRIVFWTNSNLAEEVQFEAFEETYYIPTPSLGNNSLYSNKIRIDDNTLDPNSNLSLTKRIEKSSLDKFALDSNKLGVYFSPQNSINEDIFNQLGYYEIDDYIGDPSDIYNGEYNALNSLSKNYWRKYQNKNDFEAYFKAIQLYDFTLFNYIKRLVPYGPELISGVVIEPNVLERSKVKLNNKPQSYNLTRTSSIVEPDPVLSAQSTGLTTEFTIEPSIFQATYVYNTSSIDMPTDVDKLPDSWEQNRYIGKYKIRESGSYTPIQPIVNTFPTSLYLDTIDQKFYSTPQSASLGLFYSSSIKKANVTDFYQTGYLNLIRNGCTLVSAGINVNSPDTVNGTPVITVNQINTGQIIVSGQQFSTVQELINRQEQIQNVDTTSVTTARPGIFE